MTKHTCVTPERDGLYVGYLPAPRSSKRAAILAGTFLLVWIGSMSLVFAAMMRDPGNATWDSGQIRTWEGRIAMTPYPMLISESEPSEVRLVVAMGKHGVHDRLRAFDGTHVLLEGWRLMRDGRAMIELAPEDNAIIMIEPGTGARPSAYQDPKAFDQTGEIVDGKCYLGAMKPGDGIGHRACAILCIQGGLPPMFAYTDEDKTTRFALLVVDGSTTLPEPVLGLAGRSVRVRGECVQMGTLEVLHANASGITIE